MKVTQLCPTLCGPMDYTAHGILQARILEWVGIPFSRGSSQQYWDIIHPLRRINCIHREVWPLPQSILKGFHHPEAFLECYPGTNLPGGSVVKNPPVMQETWVRSLAWEDPLEKEMSTHSSMLAGKSQGQRKLAGYSSRGPRVGHEWATEHTCTHWGTNLFLGSKPLFPFNIFPHL